MNAVLRLMAESIRGRRAGQQADASRDISFPFNDLLRDADCLQGTVRYEAIRELEALETLGILSLERHRRDPSAILRVRIPLVSLPSFYAHLGESSPGDEREKLAGLFEQAVNLDVGTLYRQEWETFCLRLSIAARQGTSVVPFDRTNLEQTKLLLVTLPRLLTWEGESLLRFVSSLVLGNSKLLELHRCRLEKALGQITNGKIQEFAQVGILENERSFLVHGPLELTFGDERMNLGLLETPFRLGIRDLARAGISTQVRQCLTVENAAMLHELAKLKGGILLASSGSEGGFANSAVISFLQQVPTDVEFFHFGDSDPKGFDILRDLRERSGRKIASLHMKYRPMNGSDPLSTGDEKVLQRLKESEFLTPTEKYEIAAMASAGFKGAFEQESLGRPCLPWPFYK